MSDKFREKFDVVRGDVLRANYGQNPWQERDQVITSVSWVSIMEDARESLLRSRWDLVIVDEAHKMSAPADDRKTYAYRLGESLSKMTDHYLLMTATPHKGDQDHFRRFLALLDPDVYGSIQSLQHAMREHEAPFYLRRTKEALVTFPHPDTGEVHKLFTKREVRTAAFDFDGEELDFYDELTRYVEDQSIAAAVDDSARGRAVGFTMALLQRRMASSVYSVRRSLERMRERREKILENPDAYRRDQIERRIPEDFEDLTEDEQLRIMGQLEGEVLSADPAVLREEIGRGAAGSRSGVWPRGLSFDPWYRYPAHPLVVHRSCDRACLPSTSRSASPPTIAPVLGSLGVFAHANGALDGISRFDFSGGAVIPFSEAPSGGWGWGAAGSWAINTPDGLISVSTSGSVTVGIASDVSPNVQNYAVTIHNESDVQLQAASGHSASGEGGAFGYWQYTFSTDARTQFQLLIHPSAYPNNAFFGHASLENLTTGKSTEWWPFLINVDVFAKQTLDPGQYRLTFDQNLSLSTSQFGTSGTVDFPALSTGTYSAQLATLPDYSFKQLALGSGGLNIDYTLTNAANFPVSATQAKVYWANGDTPIGPAITSFGLSTSPGTNRYAVPLATILAAGPVPDGATRLVVVLDPPDSTHTHGLVEEGSESNNIQGITIPVVSLQPAVVAENSAPDTVVGRLSATDPDNRGPLSYQLLNGSGVLSLVADRVVVSGPIDFETTPNLTLKVRVTDSAGYSFDKTITVTNVLELTGFDVQHSQTQRSFVRYADLTFADATTDIQSLLSQGRVQLARYGLDGSGGTAIDLSGALSVSGHNLSLDFGANGLGGNRNTTAGDGYYVLRLDLDGDGTFETTRSFYRLLGDVNGDHKVDAADTNLISQAYGTSDPERDVNGDGIVNATDRTLVLRSVGRQLSSSLQLDD